MRFYNPGRKISQMLQYTNTTKDPREGNTISYYLMDAPERDFFHLPEVVTLETPEGEVTMPVGFAKVVKREFADRGVILVDARLKEKGVEINEDDNVASSDAEARKKGDRMWKEFLRAKAAEWYATVQEIKSVGGVPRAATGLFAFALKELHMEDPADAVDTILRAKEDKVTNDDTQAKIRTLEATVNQLLGALSARGQTPAESAGGKG